MTTTDPAPATLDRLELLLDRFEAASQLLAAQQRAGDVEAPGLMVAPTLPPNVAAGQLIQSSWGNSVVNSLKLVNQTRPYIKFTGPDTTVAPSTTTNLTFTPATLVVDPGNMLRTTLVGLPATWPGLWQVNAVFKLGSHVSAKEVTCGIQDQNTNRYGQVQALSNATMGVHVATSAVITTPAAATDISLYVNHLNSSSMLVGCHMTLTWLGHSPV